MNVMNITSAQYTTNEDGIKSSIRVTVDGNEMHVPVSEGNRHYSEILRQVEAGTLTIQEAE